MNLILLIEDELAASDIWKNIIGGFLSNTAKNKRGLPSKRAQISEHSLITSESFIKLRPVKILSLWN
jgi:hypothetical protein